MSQYKEARLEPETAEIMLNMAWKRWEEVQKHLFQVETNTSFLLATNGVLLGLLVSTLTSSVFHLSNSLRYLAALPAALITVSALLCILVLKLKHGEFFVLEKARRNYAPNASNSTDLMDDLYSDLGNIVKTIQEAMIKACRWYRLALYFLVLGLLSAAFDILIVVIAT